METEHQLRSVRQHRKAMDYGLHCHTIFSNATVTLGCQSEERLLCNKSQNISSFQMEETE